MAPETLQIEVDVTAHAGSVVIKGALPGPAQAEEVKAVAANVPGVTDVYVELVAACGA